MGKKYLQLYEEEVKLLLILIGLLADSSIYESLEQHGYTQEDTRRLSSRLLVFRIRLGRETYKSESRHRQGEAWINDKH